MKFPSVRKCLCGCYPQILVRDSFVRDLCSKAELKFTEYAIKCPDCLLSTTWVEESRGGIDCAILWWNKYVSHDTLD